MRGSLEPGVFGDGNGGESKRTNGCGHQGRLRTAAGKPRFFEREVNDMGGCPFRETGMAGRFASNRAEPNLSYVF